MSTHEDTILALEQQLKAAHLKEFKQFINWDSLYLKMSLRERTTTDYGMATEWVICVELINTYRSTGNVLRRDAFRFRQEDGAINIVGVLQKWIEDNKELPPQPDPVVMAEITARQV